MKPYAVTTGEAWHVASSWSLSLLRSHLSALWQLSKPRVMLLVWLSSLAAMWLPGITFSVWQFLATAVGVWLVVASANGWNQVLERHHDAQMSRTAKRPIPSGRVSPLEAALISTLWGVLGVFTLWFGANPLTAALGAFALLTYVLVYTPAKRYTAWCTVIGAIPGAIPPVMGWTAVTGEANWQAGVLFLLQFLWQFPHFWAIAWKYRHDYQRAGFRLVPFDDEHGVRVGWAMLVASILLLGASVVPALAGWRAGWYMFGTVALGAWMISAVWRFVRRRDARTALKVMFVSLGYLPLWFVLMILTR